MAKSTMRTIVLVDDDQQHNEMLKQYLNQKYNLNIHSFVNGDDALSKIEELKPTYVILDYYLDKVDKDARNGIQILKAIKAKYPEVYVVMLSGQDKIEVAVDTMKFGAYDYVVKNPTGFVRVENVLKNIQNNLHLKFLAQSYKFTTFFLGGVILLIIIVAIILRILGISTDDIHWT